MLNEFIIPNIHLTLLFIIFGSVVLVWNSKKININFSRLERIAQRGTTSPFALLMASGSQEFGKEILLGNVSSSEIDINRTLRKIGLNKSTFYN